MSGRFVSFLNKARKKDRDLLFFTTKRTFCPARKGDKSDSKGVAGAQRTVKSTAAPIGGKHIGARSQSQVTARSA